MVTITNVSGYVNTTIPRKCGTCKYFEGGKFCSNHTVAKDPQVPTDKATGHKKVEAENGCCNEWNPNEISAARRTTWNNALAKTKP